MYLIYIIFFLLLSFTKTDSLSRSPEFSSVLCWHHLRSSSLFCNATPEPLTFLFLLENQAGTEQLKSLTSVLFLSGKPFFSLFLSVFGDLQTPSSRSFISEIQRSDGRKTKTPASNPFSFLLLLLHYLIFSPATTLSILALMLPLSALGPHVLASSWCTTHCWTSSSSMNVVIRSTTCGKPISYCFKFAWIDGDSASIQSCTYQKLCP